MANSRKIGICRLIRASLFAFMPFSLIANPHSENLEDVEAEMEKQIQLEKSANETDTSSTTHNDEKQKPPEICLFPICQDQ